MPLGNFVISTHLHTITIELDQKFNDRWSSLGASIGFVAHLQKLVRSVWRSIATIYSFQRTDRRGCARRPRCSQGTGEILRARNSARNRIIRNKWPKGKRVLIFLFPICKLIHFSQFILRCHPIHKIKHLISWIFQLYFMVSFHKSGKKRQFIDLSNNINE